MIKKQIQYGTSNTIINSMIKNKNYFYSLIDEYLADQINEVTFCDNFINAYVHSNIDFQIMTKEELMYIKNLEKVVSRFSPFEEDFINCPNAFYTKDELKQQIIETKNLLDIILYKKYI